MAVKHKMNKKRLKAFAYYGGKTAHLDFLFSHLPEDAKHYCEPFAGSATVLLNRRPAKVETLSDLDGDIVDFFRVLRDEGKAKKLRHMLKNTPYSRAEYLGSVERTGDIVEDSRRFFVRMGQGFLPKNANPTTWRVATATDNKVGTWNETVAKLTDAMEAIRKRLLRVQLENRPALDVIRIHDSPDTLFYLDPPYVFSSRAKGGSGGYSSEMTDDDHRKLAEALRGVEGRVALSGWESELYDELYEGWRVEHSEAVYVKSSITEKRRQRETLWLNFDAPAEKTRRTLDDLVEERKARKKVRVKRRR